MSSFLRNRMHLGCNVISLSQRILNYLVIDCIEWVSLMISNLTMTVPPSDSTNIWLQREVKTIFQYFIAQIPVRLANKRVSQALMEDIQNKNRFWQVKRSKRLKIDFWWAWPQATPRTGLQWLIRVNVVSLPVVAITSSDNPPTSPIWPGSQFLQSWDQPLIWRITPVNWSVTGCYDQRRCDHNGQLCAPRPPGYWAQAQGGALSWRSITSRWLSSLLKYLKIAFVWQLFVFFRRSFLLIIVEHKWWQKSHSHFCLDDFTPEQGNAQVQMPVFKCILKRGKRGQTHFGLYQARLCILSPTYRLYVAWKGRLVNRDEKLEVWTMPATQVLLITHSHS